MEEPFICEWEVKVEKVIGDSGIAPFDILEWNIVTTQFGSFVDVLPGKLGRGNPEKMKMDWVACRFGFFE